MTKKIILLTSGEPGGIGPDICLDVPLWQLPADYMLIVLGDANLLQQRAAMLGKSVTMHIIYHIEEVAALSLPAEVLIVLHIKCPDVTTVGIAKAENAPYVLQLLDTAVLLCKEGWSNRLVTAPLSKESINKAGYHFTGHTEYLARQFGCEEVVMLLANSLLKVALVTTHVPLCEVSSLITATKLEQVLKIIAVDFRSKFGIAKPRIAVCGLNPHAGEGGYLGREEVEIINPVIAKLQEDGYQVEGSFAADTIFNRAADFDVIVAMYHDQGLPVLKYAGFADGINVTLGLPILRVSVDHGTALGLAGTGLAFSSSLEQAVHFVGNATFLKNSTA